MARGVEDFQGETGDVEDPTVGQPFVAFRLSELPGRQRPQKPSHLHGGIGCQPLVVGVDIRSRRGPLDDVAGPAQVVDVPVSQQESGPCQPMAL